MLFTLRISLPDRPGTLGAIATAFGEGGANILTMDVVEIEDGIAIDDFCVDAPGGMQEPLRRAMEVVPGIVVETVRPAGAFRSVVGPMELAAVLSETPRSRVLETLVEHLPDALRADWCLVVTAGAVHPEVMAASIGSPDVSEMKTPWLPLESPQQLTPQGWMPPRWRMAMVAQSGQDGLALAAAPIVRTAGVLLGRRSGPAFRKGELEQMGQLCRIATSILTVNKRPLSKAITAGPVKGEGL